MALVVVQCLYEMHVTSSFKTLITVRFEVNRLV